MLEEGLKITASDHTIAAEALDLSLETPGAKARELAILYTKYGQPQSLRSTAVGRVRSAGQGRLHASRYTRRDLPGRDPDRGPVRMRAWAIVRENSKVKKALPVLEARLGRDHLGVRRFLHATCSSRPRSTRFETAGEQAQEQRPGAARRPRPWPSDSRNRLPSFRRRPRSLTNQIADLKQKSETGPPGTEKCGRHGDFGWAHNDFLIISARATARQRLRHGVEAKLVCLLEWQTSTYRPGSRRRAACPRSTSPIPTGSSKRPHSPRGLVRGAKVAEQQLSVGRK